MGPFRIAFIIVALTLAALISPAQAKDTPTKARLIMVDLTGCPACLAWKREIKPGYVKSDIGAQFPLTEIEVSELEYSDFFYLERPAVFPTFYIVSDEDSVLARIDGYSDGDFFWGYLEYYVRTLSE